MRHPYQSRTRSRDRRPAQISTNEPTAVTWIVVACFIFILGCVLAPLFQHLGGAQ